MADGLVVSDVLHILCSQGRPHGCSVNASTTALHLVPLGSASQYPKHPWKASQCTHSSLLRPPVWRNQGDYNPPQPKIAGTAVSAFALPPPPPFQMPVCPCKGTALLATAPCAQEHHGDGAGGFSLGTSGRATHKSCRRSTPTALCHCLAKGERFWEHQPTAEKNLKGMILDYFYKYTEQQ